MQYWHEWHGATPTLWKTITENCNYITQWISEKRFWRWLLLPLPVPKITRHTYSLLFCSLCTVTPLQSFAHIVKCHSFPLAGSRFRFPSNCNTENCFWRGCARAWAELLQQNIYTERASEPLRSACEPFSMRSQPLQVSAPALDYAQSIQTHHQTKAFPYKIVAFFFPYVAYPSPHHVRERLM